MDGIPDLIDEGKNGYLFESGNVHDLQEKLELVISDIHRAKEMGEYGYAFVRGKFATQKFFDAYREMVMEVTDSKTYTKKQ